MEEDTAYGMRISEGIVAVLFGIAAVFWPGLTIVTLLYLFATFILVAGIINLVEGIFRASGGVGSWFLRIILSVILIGVGIFLLRHPHVTFRTFILLLGFTLIFRGVIEVVMAFMEDATIGGRALLIIVGALAAIVGIIVLLQPVSAGVTFVWVLGVYALISGPIIIAMAMSEHRIRRTARVTPARAR
jgi:uncharacterized membrane protein HdeD (DUF308 family)